MRSVVVTVEGWRDSTRRVSRSREKIMTLAREISLYFSLQGLTLVPDKHHARRVRQRQSRRPADDVVGRGRLPVTRLVDVAARRHLDLSLRQ
jgi:hypothetical protein